MPDLKFNIDGYDFTIPSTGYMLQTENYPCELQVKPYNTTAFGQAFLMNYFLTLDFDTDNDTPIGFAQSLLNTGATITAPADSGLDTWAIVLIVLGSVLLLAIIIFCCIKHKKAQNEKRDANVAEAQAMMNQQYGSDDATQPVKNEENPNDLVQD